MKHEWIITVFMLMMAGGAWAEELPKPPSCPLYTGGKASQQQGAVAAQDTQSQVQSSENIAQSQTPDVAAELQALLPPPPPPPPLLPAGPPRIPPQ